MDNEHYTPTTAEVRETYGDLWDDYRELAEAEFDRWLEAHERMVAEITLYDAARDFSTGQITFVGSSIGYVKAWLRSRAVSL